MKPLPLDDETLTEVQESLQGALGLVLVVVLENFLQLCLELYVRHVPFILIGGCRERVLQRFQHRPLDLLRDGVLCVQLYHWGFEQRKTVTKQRKLKVLFPN